MRTVTEIWHNGVLQSANDIDDTPVDVQAAILDLDTIINKDTWTNTEAIQAIQKEAQILKAIIRYIRTRI